MHAHFLCAQSSKWGDGTKMTTRLSRRIRTQFGPKAVKDEFEKMKKNNAMKDYSKSHRIRVIQNRLGQKYARTVQPVEFSDPMRAVMKHMLSLHSFCSNVAVANATIFVSPVSVIPPVSGMFRLDPSTKLSPSTTNTSCAQHRFYCPTFYFVHFWVWKKQQANRTGMCHFKFSIGKGPIRMEILHFWAASVPSIVVVRQWFSWH